MRIRYSFMLSVLLFLLVSTSVSQSIIISNSRVDTSEVSVYSMFTQQPKKPDLQIMKITDGYGLSYHIINIGDHIIQDVFLKINLIEGTLFHLGKTEVHIQEIQPGTTQEIPVNLFGFTLGFYQLYPMITATVIAEGRIQDQHGVLIRIIGPLVSIRGEYFNTPLTSEGITLFAPEYSNDAYLLDNSGSILHHWECQYIQGLAVYLLENGNLVRSNLPGVNPRFTSGGMSGRVELYDWNSSLLWRFDYFNDTVCLHHDVEPLPNGNILMISWEYKTREEAIAKGRNPDTLRQNELWPDHIIEVKPIGTNQAEIVWEWHAWDHIIQEYDTTKPGYGSIKDHPDKIDINYGSGQADWLHINSVDYNEELDQILLSVHNFNEIWVIDHSTTTEEARGSTGGQYGKGGDILYRWGNPQAYRRGGREDQQLFGQHDAQWITKEYPGGGNILVFNNGGQGRSFSSVDEIIPPVNEFGIYAIQPQESYAPDKAIWTYTAENPRDFYAGHISGCQRLKNGNTLICNGPQGYFFEVTPQKQMVWLYTNPYPDIFDNHVFKIRRYTLDYPGLNQLFE